MIPPLECLLSALGICHANVLTTVLLYKTMYNIKAVIASFLLKLQQNFAQSQDFPIHTTKRVVLRFCKMNG
jgi:hypothetical protein